MAYIAAEPNRFVEFDVARVGRGAKRPAAPTTFTKPLPGAACHGQNGSG